MMNKVKEIYSDFFQPGNVTTDTRNIIPGGIFIALKGTNFDGNEFASEALQKGAALAIVDNPKISGNRIIYVKNSLVFLQDIARYHRQLSGFKVLGLTGTNGKTTTKELLKSILSERFRCKATEGNLNNHIGVPLTLLSTPADTEWAIIEMGANHPGEIKELCSIALPDAGLITNIGRAHLEGFGSFEGVKMTKAELYDSVRARSGKIYINNKNTLLNELIGKYTNIVKYYGNESMCHASIIRSLPTLEFLLYHYQKSITITSGIYGEYNLENILAAAAVGLDLGLSLFEIKSGIEKYLPSNNRSQVVIINTTTFILDCYNANPSSMQLAIKSFAEIKAQKKILVLGGMKELGKYSKEEHQKLIVSLKSYHFDEIIFIGNEFLSKDFIGNYYDSIESFSQVFQKIDFSNATVLVKGSRAYKLENIIDLFKSTAN